MFGYIYTDCMWEYCVIVQSTSYLIDQRIMYLRSSTSTWVNLYDVVNFTFHYRLHGLVISHVIGNAKLLGVTKGRD